MCCNEKFAILFVSLNIIILRTIFKHTINGEQKLYRGAEMLLRGKVLILIDIYLAEFFFLSLRISSRLFFAHSISPSMCGMTDFPLSDSEYSTRGGTSAYDFLRMYPSSSNVRNVDDSIFCEISGILCLNELNRIVPF